MYEFDTLLSYYIHLVVHQVAIDESSDNTPTGSDWTRSYPAVITNPNLTNLTPVSYFFLSLLFIMYYALNRFNCLLRFQLFIVFILPPPPRPHSCRFMLVKRSL